jgi:hypothetical protein
MIDVRNANKITYPFQLGLSPLTSLKNIYVADYAEIF